MLDPIDRDKICLELDALYGCVVGGDCASDGMVSLDLTKKCVKRLRAILPPDPDLVDEDNVQGLDSLYRFLDDFDGKLKADEAALSGDEREIVVGPNWRRRLCEVIGEFSPERPPDPKTLSPFLRSLLPENETPMADSKPEKPPRRRGKKADAENAIRHYVVDRQGYYDSLKPRCQQHEAAACKQAEKMFSRNRLAKVLGLSDGLVSSTAAWKQIRADLFPDSPDNALSKLRHSGGRVGFAIAEEAAGQAHGDQTVDAVVRNETLELIRAAKLPQEAAEQIVNQLHAGEISDSDARMMLESCQDSEASGIADIEAEHQRPPRQRIRNSDR